MSVIEKRNLNIDLLRVLACIMVVTAHTASYYFFNFKNTDDHFWGNLFGSAVRACVPLFILISGALLLPIKISTTEFIKKRFARVFFPFVFWSLLFCIIDILFYDLGFKSIFRILITNSPNAPQLWYLYVLIGLYLFIPIISAWISIASKNELIIFLSLWVFSLFLPFIKKVVPEPFGMAWWNEFGAFYYFSGYIGYLVLGHFLTTLSIKKNLSNFLLGCFLFLLGYSITFGGQQYVYYKLTSFYTVLWAYTSINVLFMLLGIYLIVNSINFKSAFFTKIIVELSNMSFGIYLVHFPFVNFFHNQLYSLGLNQASVIAINTLISFILSYIIIKLISFLTWKKYIIG